MVRAVLLGLVLVILNVWWVTMIEVRFNMLDGSSLPLFVTPVFLLLVLVIVNHLVGRFAPKIALTQQQLLTAYLMAVVSNTFAGHDMLQNLFGTITHPYYFAPQNHWQEVFIAKLPRNLFISDPEALTHWYRGNTPPAQAQGYLVHWAVPLTLWGGFFLTLVTLFLCITLLVRKGWMEEERLAFPIIQLPLALTDPTAALFRQPLMWVGFAVAFGISGLNGIHELVPQVPNIPFIKIFDLGQFFVQQPWEAIRSYGMTMSLYPFMIGLAYFIPLDLAFSCWFSYLLLRVYFVTGRAFGWDSPSAGQGWPFLPEVSGGAWMGVAGAILWVNRKRLVRAFDTAFDRGETGRTLRQADPQEGPRLRWAFIGIAVCCVLLLLWSQFLLNLSPLVATGFFGIMLALSLGITRVRAEFGTPHEIVFVKPADTLVTLFGTRALGNQNLIGMESMYWFNRGYRCHPIPNFLEGFKMTEGRESGGFTVNRLIGVFALAAIVSLVTTFVCNYFITYQAGAASKAEAYKQWVGGEAFGQLANWIQFPKPPASRNFWFFAGGLIVVGLLAVLRTAFIGWPLHPVGFALGISYAMNYFWMCVLVAWVVKLFITRYGGMTAHRRAIPFFLGLVLGDYVAGALWSLLGLWLGQTTYKIFI